jgi:hypothetical protein
MNLDLRIPMGLMFTLVGMILSSFGAMTTSRTELYSKSLGVDVNLWWGLVLLAFGLIMLTLGRRGQRRLEKQPPPQPQSSEPRRGH